MRIFISAFGVTLALAFTVPAFAGDSDNRPKSNAKKMAATGMLRLSPVQGNIERKQLRSAYVAPRLDHKKCGAEANWPNH
jgi:hypothetical protein